MKKLSYFFIFFFLVFCSDISYGAYCNTASLTSYNITPESFNQSTATFNSGKRAFVFTATAGCTYTFSTCGTTSMDTYLRLYSGAGGTLLVSADDNCGTQSQIVWTCTTNGTYSVLLTRYSCSNLNTNVYMNYSKSCPVLCTQNSLTLTMNDSWGDGWNGGSITLTDNSGGNYGPFSITGSTGTQTLCLPDGCYSINQVAGSYPGEITWSLSNGISGDGFYGSQSNVFTLGSGSCGAITGCTDPAAVNYNPLATISDGSCVYPPSNDNPCSAIALPVNLSCSFATYTNANATATSGVPAPGCANYVGSDVWFTVIVPASGIVNLDMQTGIITDAGMAVYSGSCGSLTLIECDDDDSPNGLMSAINLTGQTPGSTLWIRVWEYGGDNNGTFGICASSPLTYQDTWVSMNTGNANWCVGETRNVSVTVTNSGSATWTNTSPDINIGVKWNAEADYFVRVDANGLTPGTTQTYTLSVTAPSTPGSNNLTFDIVNEGNFWFANNSNGGGPGNIVYTSSEITINEYPVVNAGADQVTCSSNSVNLSGSASVEGSGSQVFTWTGEGYDNAYYFVGGTTSGIPAGAVITGITVNGSIVSASGTSWCPSWYSFDVWLNGSWQTFGCNGDYNLTALNGLSANGQLIQISSYDEDVYGDYCYMTLTATVNYSYSNTPSISWSPATNLSSTTILNPVATLTLANTYTLTADNNGCTSSDQVTISVNNPTLATAPANGDMVWRGASSNDWATIGNWWQYNGSAYTAATAAPTTAQNVVIPVNQTCVLNQPNTNANTGNANSLYIENGATLTMGSGNLNVAGNWENNGSFIPGAGTVTFEGTGNHTISGSSAAHNFNNLSMNKTGEVQLNVPIAMTGTLTLTNGRLNIGNFNLDLPTNTINGGNANSYVKTTGTGVLMRNVGASTVDFPVGRGAYNPAALTNSGTSDKFSVRVIDNVSDNGDNADTDATTSMAVVNRTWMIDEQNAGGSNITLRLNWNGAGEEINGFQGINAFIAHYMTADGLWDNIGGTTPSLNVIETGGITSFSPFTISSDTEFAPLPVELISFYANCLNNDVVLKWQTASEHNSKNFVIQVSEDGINWSVLAALDAAGNSNTLMEYSFIHQNGARMKNYYKLIQYDIDGQENEYNVIMSNCTLQDELFMTYPNPSSGSFSVLVKNNALEGQNVLNIMDNKGVIVYTFDVLLENGSGSFTIEGLDLPVGLYFLQLNNGSHTSGVIKHSLR